MSGIYTAHPTTTLEEEAKILLTFQRKRKVDISNPDLLGLYLAEEALGKLKRALSSEKVVGVESQRIAGR